MQSARDQTHPLPPYRPQTNGKAERFIRTLLHGWAYGAIYHSSQERTAALDGWLWHYNHRRKHQAIGRQPRSAEPTCSGPTSSPPRASRRSPRGPARAPRAVARRCRPASRLLRTPPGRRPAPGTPRACAGARPPGRALRQGPSGAAQATRAGARSRPGVPADVARADATLARTSCPCTAPSHPKRRQPEGPTQTVGRRHSGP
ncbi:MAG: transposase [Thermoleophilia bacterium]|nr:transposase [Thermoleophilia bacterium]